MCCAALHQLRQVSQAKRWDDVGTGRRTIRQSRLIESLEFPDEEYGINLGIVSVRGQVGSTPLAGEGVRLCDANDMHKTLRLNEWDSGVQSDFYSSILKSSRLNLVGLDF